MSSCRISAKHPRVPGFFSGFLPHNPFRLRRLEYSSDQDIISLLIELACQALSLPIIGDAVRRALRRGPE
jgi:hypothetical protein